MRAAFELDVLYQRKQEIFIPTGKPGDRRAIARMILRFERRSDLGKGVTAVVVHCELEAETKTGLTSTRRTRAPGRGRGGSDRTGWMVIDPA